MSGAFTIVPVAHAAALSAAFETAFDPIVINIIKPLVILAFAVAMVVFVWGVVQMVTHEVDAEAHKHGRWSMVGGLAGLLIMSSAWAIINIVRNTVSGFK